MPDARALFLFSSNIRPLYEQDNLNVLAAPTGLPYRFRYHEEHLSPGLAKAWDSLKGRTCITHFSLQQPRQYHDAVIFPLRTGTVTRATREAGGVFLLEFSVGGAVSLKEPAPSNTNSSASRSQAYRDCVDQYRAYLTSHDVKLPYEAWASLGPDIMLDDAAPVDVRADEGATFERSTRYLAGTSSYQNAVFYRLLRLERRDGDKSREIPFTPGVGYRLVASKAYHLVFLQCQPHEVSSARTFSASVDESIGRVVGLQGFEVASRYDVTSVPIITAELSEARPREGVLEIAPEGGFQGPVLTVPLRVEPEALKTTGAVVASIAGLVLVGLASLLSSLSWPAAVGSLALGTFLATLVPLAMTGRTPWSS